MAGEYQAHLERENMRLRAELGNYEDRSALWNFCFQPNIWGAPNDPPFHPMFTRSDNKTGICIVSAYDLVSVPVEDWYQYLENTWDNFKEENVAPAQPTD